jgi:hypothetical protein
LPINKSITKPSNEISLKIKSNAPLKRIFEPLTAKQEESKKMNKHSQPIVIVKNSITFAVKQVNNTKLHIPDFAASPKNKQLRKTEVLESHLQSYQTPKNDFLRTSVIPLKGFAASEFKANPVLDYSQTADDVITDVARSQQQDHEFFSARKQAITF